MSSTRSSSPNASFVLNTLSFAKIFSLSYLKDKTKKFKETLFSVKIDLQQCGIIINKVDTASVKKCSNLLGKAIAKLESLQELKRVDEKKLKDMVEVLIKILKSFETKKFTFRISSLVKDITLDKSFDQLVKEDASDDSSSDDSSSDDSSSDDSSSDDSSSDDSSSDDSSSDSSSDSSDDSSDDSSSDSSDDSSDDSSSDSSSDSSDSDSSDSEDDKKKRKKSSKGKTAKKVRLDIKTLEKYAKVLTSDKRYKHLLKAEKKDEKKADKKAEKKDKKVKFEPIVVE